MLYCRKTTGRKETLARACPGSAAVRHRSRWPFRSTRCATLPGLVLLLFTSPLWAVDLLQVDIGDVASADWGASGLRFELSLGDDDAPVARLSAAEATLGDAAERWTDIVLSCPGLEMAANVVRCPQLGISAISANLGPQRLGGLVAFNLQSGAAKITLEGGSVAGSPLQLEASLTGAGWQGKLDLPGIDLARLLALTARFLPESEAGQINGSMALMLDAAGTVSGPDTISIAVAAREVSASNASGTIATDAMATTLQLDATRNDAMWRIQATQGGSAGQAYAEPVFVDLGVQPQRASIDANLDLDQRLLEIARWEFEQPGVVSAHGTATVIQTDEGPQLARLSGERVSAQLPGAFDTYVRPYLFATPLDALESAGAVEIRVLLSAGQPVAFSARLDDISVEDKTGRFGLSGATGTMHWRDPAITATVAPDWPARSEIAWTGATLMQLPAGAAQVAFVAEAGDFRLTSPLQLPLLDGELNINELEVLRAGEETMQLLLDAALAPVSLTQLTTALGWPVFAGQIGGRLPSLSYRNGVNEVGGKLEAQLFGGNLQIGDLQVVQPLGNLPQLFADIRFTNFDLETLTETFSFGRITGHVDGEISGLQMLQWEPVAFTASLTSTAKDTTKRRISQRAVENISSVSGGGAAAALSSGVMGFFDDFAYDSLGLKCQLRDGVCNMGGIAKAKTGYYIVRGRGLPRIDVIGYASQVDWTRLVEQLKAIQQSGAPVTGSPQ